MKYAEAKFLSLYFISFREVEKKVSLHIKFRKAFKGNFADLVSEENFIDTFRNYTGVVWIMPINSVQLLTKHY